MKGLWLEFKSDLKIIKSKFVWMVAEFKRDWIRFEIWLERLANKWL